MFDKVEIVVRSGKGGSGVVSFRREKFVPFGGPDGGDGGDGGSVVLRADPSVTNLSAFRYKARYKAAAGGDGKGKKKHGRRGDNLVLAVPEGTVVWHKGELEECAFIADLAEAGQQVVVARGGRGGWGNTRLVSSINQAPRLAQRGEDGEEAAIILELRLIADVGIIGYPNVGKSTLLAAASAAKPEIAGYPFTTRKPVLGVAEVGQQTMILAEIPGLIDGAHLGRGLGHEFLRHVMRTRILIHVLDGTSASPVEDMVRVNTELSLFDPALVRKPQVVVVNKVDLAPVQPRLDEIKSALRAAGTSPLFISAATGEGVNELLVATVKMLQSVAGEVEDGEEVPRQVFRPQPRGTVARVHKEGDTFVVVAPELERIVGGMNVSRYEVQGQLRKRFARLGVDRALQKAGVKPGDKVRCGDLEWEW